MNLHAWLAVALLGGAGACLRWALGLWLIDRSGRWSVDRGVLAANVTGSLLLGALVGSGSVEGGWGYVVGLGFCGALTTWSTPVVQALQSRRGSERGGRWWDLSWQVTCSFVAFGLGLWFAG